MAKEFELFSKNYEAIQVAPAAAKSAGEFETYNEVNGFHLVDFSSDQVSAGEETTLITKAETVRVVKHTGETWAPGEAVAWVDASSYASNVVGSDILIGYVKEAAASADTEGVISFDGFASQLKA